jgi:L-ascorbate metabolism protein UlaG (beta-lactamase superfamily)
MKITYLGHASLLIEIEGKAILVDPFISGNELAKHIDINQLQADYI